MMRFPKYTLIALAIVLAACGGSPEITLENASLAESATSTADSGDEAAADEAEETDGEAEVEDSSADQSEPVQVTTEEAAAAAEANLSLLAGGDTVFEYEVLDVQTGGISSVGEVVDGDRSVLLWFFSPH